MTTNAPNPPSAAEPQPKPGTATKDAPPAPEPAPRKGIGGDAPSPQVAPEPPGGTPVNPEQSDG